jgi:hypothetical protein
MTKRGSGIISTGFGYHEKFIGGEGKLGNLIVLAAQFMLSKQSSELFEGKYFGELMNIKHEALSNAQCSLTFTTSNFIARLSCAFHI